MITVTFKPRIPLAAMVLLIVALSPAAPAAAATPAGPHHPGYSDRTPLRVDDGSAIEAVIDGAMAAAMRDHDIPGGTVSVVGDGRVLVSKGYGFADLAARRKVDPSTSLFRIGSVTKLFTWTAVMQLVERGRIDLDADINTYLDSFSIPATFDAPVTMADLMTHTAGFEDRQLGLSVLDVGEHRSLRSYVTGSMPARIFEPGTITAYSNYGTALAGYVVERLSGMPFEDYVQRHILDPLDMRHSTLSQVLPAELATHLASSYVDRLGVQQALPPEYFEIVPASGMSATASDMAEFMMAHLPGGDPGAGRLLAPATLEAMHARQFGNDARLSGMTYGFVEARRGDVRLLTHRGTTNFEQFHSILVLAPGDGVGIFVSFNSEGGAAGRTEVVEALLDALHPAAAPQPEPVPMATDGANRLAGSYASTRANETTIEKFVGLVPTQINIVVGDDGSIWAVGGPMGENPREFVEVERNLLQEVGGSERIAFADRPAGGPYLFLESMPIVGFGRQSWWETSWVNLALLAVTMLIFLLSILAIPIAWLRNRVNGGDRSSLARLARTLAWLASALFLAFPVLLIAGLSNIEHGVNGTARTALDVGVVGTGVAVALVVATLLAWRSSAWGFVGKAYQLTISFAAIAFVWFLQAWNLLGTRL